MITLQIQNEIQKEKALPSNCVSKDTAYCNGRIPVSGVGPFLIIFLLLASTASASVPDLNSTSAVNSIIGEAEGEPLIGKIAIGEVIRNKGNLKGVFGLYSPRVSLASRAVRQDGELAWAKSKDSNLTRGATIWGSASDVAKWKARAKKNPRHWFNRVYQTARIFNHFFFAERKSK